MEYVSYTDGKIPSVKLLNLVVKARITINQMSKETIEKKINDKKRFKKENNN